MSVPTKRAWSLLAVLLVGVLWCAGGTVPAQAEDFKTQDGGIDPGRWVLGMRAGFAPLTQQLTRRHR